LIKATRINISNATITVDISADEYSKKLDDVATRTSKTISMAGFRKGKVPVKLVKQHYAKALEEDVQNDIVSGAFNDGLKELGLNKDDVLLEPKFEKFDKNDDNSMHIEMKVSLKPIFSLSDYVSEIPEILTQDVDDSEVEKTLKEMANGKAPMLDITDRELQNDDYADIDFDGYIDDKQFDGGKSQGYSLHIGSKSFIGNFEEQLIGMKIDDSRDVNVKFPDDYNSVDLQGKDAKFIVKLNFIKAKGKVDLSDEVAREIIPNQKDDFTLSDAKVKIKEDLVAQKYQKHFFNDLKDTFINNLLSAHDFPLPEIVVEEELANLLNEKVSTYNEDELKKIQDNKEEQEKLREENREDAEKRVKATFIISEIAQKEHIQVSDDSVTQRLYLNALYTNQDPEAYIKQYQDSNMLPGIKMMMVEESVINHLFNKKVKEKA